MRWTHAHHWGWVLDHIIVCSKTLHQDLSNKGSKIFSSLIFRSWDFRYYSNMGICWPLEHDFTIFQGKNVFLDHALNCETLKKLLSWTFAKIYLFFWMIWRNFSPPHKDKAILRVLSISKEVLALTNTWFFAFSIHSMKFCLLQFSPFFACHFIKKLKRIKKGEKSWFFSNEGCGFLFTKRKIKVVIFLSYDHWIWDQKLCISEGWGGKHSGIFYIVFISVNFLHFQFYLTRLKYHPRITFKNTLVFPLFQNLLSFDIFHSNLS